MGWERKRGKLEELNRLLRGEGADRFSTIVGDLAVLSNIRYVITLDTDTQLPRDTARQLVGAMAHPLNRPRYDEQRGCVVEGYGILQPRIGIAMAGAGRSLYAWVSCSDPGVDPYTRVVSDVYQDLFSEGSFIGKGIYDVDAFRSALEGRMPENRILSHDLLEGCHARSGLLSDVLLYEETPARYLADVSRRHRWLRGDIQIARWAQRLPVQSGHSTPSASLSALNRWKIIDNVRRGLIPPALATLLIAGWFLPTSPLATTLAVLAILFVPPLIATLLDLVRKRDDARLSQHVHATLRGTGAHFAQSSLALVMLIHEALSHLDAFILTLWRMWVSRTRLLEWNTARDAERSAGAALRSGPAGVYRMMWGASVLALAIGAALVRFHPSTLLFAAPFLALWLAAPAVAWWISRTRRRRPLRLTAEQTTFLRATARKTWRFFETFVGTDDNWLPPDNFQEHPTGVVAHRTSPTNMGLSLLANLAAHDFGYITGGQLLERTQSALSTMARLERYRRHFLNWYDTQTLEPLLPRYVSSVDSGNLAGHLLVLRSGLIEIADAKIIGLPVFEGLSDTLAVIATNANGAIAGRLAALRKVIDSAYDSRPSTIAAMSQWITRLRNVAIDLPTDVPESSIEERFWMDAFVAQCEAALREIEVLLPSPMSIDASAATATAT